MKQALAPRTYADLKRGVAETLLAGQRRVEQARVLTYFETGRLINEHVRVHGGRADYGAHVLERLARDLAIARTTLFQCAQFARYFSEKPIVRHGGQLGWAHYRLLCQVDDEKQRAALLADTVRHEWTSPELQQRVRAFNAPVAAAAVDPTDSPRLLIPRCGRPGCYPVISRRGALALDLGFKMYLPLEPAEVRRLKVAAGAIVRIDEAHPFASDPGASKAGLFTYRTLETRVVDGDTLAVSIALPPGREIDKKLRLRGLDCPEIDTPEGKAARRFVQSLVDRATAITIATTKPDKYDRYLADVFLEGDFSELAPLEIQPGDVSAPLFLNNALLANGHARRSDEPPPL